METIDNSSHEKDSGIGRTDESTKNDDSSDGLECLESHSFGDYYNYHHHYHHHHQQQQQQQQQHLHQLHQPQHQQLHQPKHQHQQQQQQQHQQQHQQLRQQQQQQQQQQRTRLAEPDSIVCSGQCGRHKNLSPVKDSTRIKTHHQLFDRKISTDHGSSTRDVGDRTPLSLVGPAAVVVGWSREKNRRDKLERLEMMRCHYECRLLQLELMKIGRNGRSDSRILDVNRNLVGLRRPTSDENSNVKMGGAGHRPAPPAARGQGSIAAAHLKQRSRSSEVDYCARNLYKKSKLVQPPRTASHQYHHHHQQHHQGYHDPAASPGPVDKFAPNSNSPSRRSVPKMGVRRLEESIHIGRQPRFGESKVQPRHQDPAEVSVRQSRSFFVPEKSRFHHPPSSNPSKLLGSVYRNENFISSPARYRVENGRIYRLPLATKDVPKSERLVDCFQAFMPLSSNLLFKDRPCQERNFNRPLFDARYYNNHHNQHQHHNNNLHLQQHLHHQQQQHQHRLAIRDSNNNNNNSSGSGSNNNNQDDIGWEAKRQPRADGLQRRPWFGSLTQVDVGRACHVANDDQSPRLNRVNSKVWDFLRRESDGPVLGGDAFDNYVEWLAVGQTPCLYENLKSATEPQVPIGLNHPHPVSHQHQHHHHHHRHHHARHHHHHRHHNQQQQQVHSRPIYDANSDFECRRLPSTETSVRECPATATTTTTTYSDDSDNDYVDIDLLSHSPPGSDQQPPEVSKRKDQTRHGGQRKSLKKKQLLRERAKKLAEERNTRARQESGSTSGGNARSTSRGRAGRKGAEKRRSRQKLVTSLAQEGEERDCSRHSEAATEADDDDKAIKDDSTENVYSTLVDPGSSTESEPALGGMADKVDSVALFVGQKRSPSMTTV